MPELGTCDNQSDPHPQRLEGEQCSDLCVNWKPLKESNGMSLEEEVREAVAARFQRATADLIGYGIAGSMIDSAIEILYELDPDMEAELYAFQVKVLAKFHAAETLLFTIGKRDSA